METHPFLKQLLIVTILFCSLLGSAQRKSKRETPGGGFMIGYRSTISSFTDANALGFGSGAHFRLQFGKKLNSEFYYDHIITNLGGIGRRVDEHIGWSVMYYPFEQHTEKGKFSFHMEAGHCFDYTTVRANLIDGSNSSRWSAAVQAGLGVHYNLSKKANITLKSQYMLHIGKEIHAEVETDANDQKYLHVEKESAHLDGHLLTTLSINFLIADFW